MDNYKEVDFITYCATCKYKDAPETEEPCDECLHIPARCESHKPIQYEEKAK